MTKNTLRIELTCNGRVLSMGPGEDMDITKVSGLESSELEVSTSDNALVDGVTVDGKKIRKRTIHIEAKFRNSRNNREKRMSVIQFFNPKYTGKALITNMGIPRNIEYELEGWNFAEQKNLDQRIGIIVDLMCPDPFMKNIDNFGRNMADITKHIAFPWRVVKKKASVPDPYKGLALTGQITGYKTLKREVQLLNDGDVPTGVQIKFIAERGPVKNPKITKVSTGQFVRVKVEMKQGDVLMVDTDQRHQVIELNGVNVYQKIDRLSESFELEVGSNYLLYDADENYTNLDVKLYYTPKYLGV